ncbi:indole-3-glycerol phosphate synthase TrpC [Desulforamulus aquiferis]|uniref:Indole-3-glycerol phosphate synthase n=1 Tax=Desulforamulus aquiferis TaxID=1397668 RepID=A0AAW7ZGU2_9FIRM|nr:indole-3-glycerol phosphate synthase TrpC [Desulforamulus aquiferis]MDO7788497.1 indole-3-glycerol phosphate synthase TrpC [Desulforamulus aquiferis]RYD01906.1 hypothetical protein N752_27665 [Desulforamulus aquiferis]
MILDRIVEHKRQEVSELLSKIKIDDMVNKIGKLPPGRDFRGAISRPGQVGLIAEIKKSSPSKGLLCKDFDHRYLAKIYQNNGASAVSVLTDERFFEGRLEYLSEVHEEIGLPLLRKDFIIDPIQLYQSRIIGADAVLLIVAILSDDELADMLQIAGEIGLQALVEVHTAKELERALAAGANIIGINNRNLHTFDTDLAITSYLMGRYDLSGITVVSESGISNKRHMEFLKNIGVNAALVGEALVRAEDTGERVKELVQGGGSCG